MDQNEVLSSRLLIAYVLCLVVRIIVPVAPAPRPVLVPPAWLSIEQVTAEMTLPSTPKRSLKLGIRA